MFVKYVNACRLLASLPSHIDKLAFAQHKSSHTHTPASENGWVFVEWGRGGGGGGRELREAGQRVLTTLTSKSSSSSPVNQSNQHPTHNFPPPSNMQLVNRTAHFHLNLA